MTSFEARCQREDEEDRLELLAPPQRKVIIEALEIYRAFGVYGEGRDEHQAAVQRVIDLVEQDA